MSKTICIFEDEKFADLIPLVYFRPVYELKCGIFTLREKIERFFKSATVSLHCRGYLEATLKQQFPRKMVNKVADDTCLFLNGRVVMDDNLNSELQKTTGEVIFKNGDTVIGFRLSGENLSSFSKLLNSPVKYSHLPHLKEIEVEARIINFPWDLITLNKVELPSDIEYLSQITKNLIDPLQIPNTVMLNPEKIFIEKGCTIKPGVVLDAEDGPIFIGKNVKLLHNSVIQGPVYIGHDSTIKVGANIYHNSSIGPVCKIGGEVGDSIIHSYSNKQHNGFLGHSYLASWINLGAGTNNSDLKNNYGTIKIFINGRNVDSGSQFAGLTMGDHSKCAINTMFNTGTVVGVSSNIFGAGFPPKSFPSFGWGGGESVITFELEKALDVAKKVMERRNVYMTDEEESLFKYLFEITKSERLNTI